jgi:sporulation protein YlmC with PRC-barrel domain
MASPNDRLQDSVVVSADGPAVPNTAGDAREARVEDLVGRRLCDVDGRKVGRIEELVAELRGTDWVVIEVHVGPAALLERLVDLSTLFPLLSTLERRLRKRYRIPWEQLDLTDPRRPTATVAAAALGRVDP